MDNLQRGQLEALEQRGAQVIRDLHYITEHLNYPRFAGIELEFNLADHLGLMQRLLQDVRQTLAAHQVSPLELKTLLAFNAVVDDSLRMCHTIIGNLHRSSAR